MAEAMSIEDNYFLDPVAILPELQALQAAGSNESPPSPTRPNFGEVDLFVLSDVTLRAEILFLSASTIGPNPLPIPVVLGPDDIDIS